MNLEPVKILLLCLLMLPGLAAANTYTLTAAEWSRPRSAAMVTNLQPVAAAVREWHATVGNDGIGRLVLRHAAGEEAALWANELRDWLVALGVTADAIVLQLGGVSDSEIELEVRRR